MLMLEKIIYQELFYKLDIIIDYLKNHDGYNYKLHNYVNPISDNIPDINIVDFAEEIKDMILMITIDINQ